MSYFIRMSYFRQSDSCIYHLLLANCEISNAFDIGVGVRWIFRRLKKFGSKD